MKLGMILGVQKGELYKVTLNGEKLRRRDINGQLAYHQEQRRIEKVMEGFNIPVNWLDDRPIA